MMANAESSGWTDITKVAVSPFLHTLSHRLSDILFLFLPHEAYALLVLLKIQSWTINPNVPNNKLHVSLKVTL